MSTLIGGKGLLMLGVVGEPDRQGLENLSRCQRDWRLTSVSVGDTMAWGRCAYLGLFDF
jgi:hypothetical protein